MTTHVAVDLGANGGKTLLGKVQDDCFRVEEVYHFDNRPVLENGRYVWDIRNLRKRVVMGLREAKKRSNEITSVGIDSWGVDFGLIGIYGDLIQNPYSYRDPRVSSTVDQITGRISKRELFKITGINHWNIANTLWQYHYLSRKESGLLRRTKCVLMIPQLISFMLGGDVCAEETLASTTQMMDVNSRAWSEKIAGKLDLPFDRLPGIREPGVKIGALHEKAEAPKIKAEIVLPASHDTAAAVAGMPLDRNNKAFLSTGTWFVLGLELNKPCLSKEAFELGASNEVGVGGTIRFLKNITGFFLLEECRRRWKENNRIYSYDELLKRASETAAFGPLIDPDDPSFVIEADMPHAIASYCRRSWQDAPRSEGQIARCIFESLAVKIALTIERMGDVAGIKIRRLNLGGGGVRNDLLCQMISSAASIPLDAGPPEVTAVGNILTQAIAYSEIGDIAEGRRLVAENMEIKKFEPEENQRWREAKDKMETFGV